MNEQFWKIGELAEKTGLTVRTLHHYDEIGLLSPSYRTTGDHRLYSSDDVARLQQIISLKSLGFSLDHITDALTKPEFAPEKVLKMQLDHVTKQMKLTAELQERLEGMQRFIESRGPLSSEEFLTAIKLMSDVESMYTDEERDSIRAQGEKYGKEEIIKVENEWPQLMEKMKKRMEDGEDPASDETQKLGKHWKELVEMFTGGNPAIAAKLKKMYAENPEAGKTFGGPGFDPKLFEYVERAMKVQKND